MTGTEVVERAAQRLRDAAGRGVPCLPIRDLVSDGDVATAYAVQRRNLDLRVAGGARRVGRKIGLTSAAVQNQLGVTQPDTGWLFDDMAVPSGGIVPAGRLLQPRVEAEVAFWLAADIPADVDSIDDVRAAISTVVAAIEIVDSRVRDWDISIVDTVADNASSGMFVIADHRVPIADIDPQEVWMTMRRNGEVVSTGSGTACLGDPLNAVLWLARASAQLGDPLRRGELILSGALGPLVPAGPGDHVRAELSGLGTVDVRFAGGVGLDG